MKSIAERCESILKKGHIIKDRQWSENGDAFRSCEAKYNGLYYEMLLANEDWLFLKNVGGVFDASDEV